MYKIKQLPEDFIVRERLNLNLVENGQYSYYLLKKKNYSTFDAVAIIANRLRINPKFINAAGLKDRRAETEQYISINKGKKTDLELNKELSLNYVGSGNDRLNIGTLKGNEFNITIRNLENDQGFSLKKIDYVVNYFDEQRFGRDKDNHIIGKMLVKKQFKEASAELEKKGIAEITEHLNNQINDYVGALRRVNRKILRFYMTSYQSYLWNVCVKNYLDYLNINKIQFNHNLTFLELGFDIEEKDSIRLEIINKLLAAEGIKPHDFINRQMSELTLEIQERSIFAKIEDLTFSEIEEDELNPGMFKIKVSFYLSKGSYATNVIRELFSQV
jgi:tRNA pseudouridine13 synthase